MEYLLLLYPLLFFLGFFLEKWEFNSDLKKCIECSKWKCCFLKLNLTDILIDITMITIFLLASLNIHAILAFCSGKYFYKVTFGVYKVYCAIKERNLTNER